MTSKLRLADRTNDLFPILGFLAAMASLAMPLNAWLVAFILAGAVVAAVHHAEVIAHRVGEPFGTLILALAVTVIEVGLILTLMQAEPEKAQTLARDTVFAAVMVILNLLMGLCLLSGAIRHHEQRFQRTGIGAALATLTVLTVVTLVLPNFTSSVPGPFYSATQLGFVAAVSLILYATFALVQTVRHRDYFLPDGDADGDGEPDAHAAPPSAQRTAVSGALLLASLFAVVLLAKALSPVIALAKVVRRWNPDHPDPASLAPERLPAASDSDVEVLVAALYNFANRLEAFVERAAARSSEQVHPFDFTGFEGRDDLIYYTSIPWVSFTQLNHTITHDREDSVPRLSWGKYREEGGCVVLPYSVQVHHAFVDGIHIARFKDALEAMLNAL